MFNFLYAQFGMLKELAVEIKRFFVEFTICYLRVFRVVVLSIHGYVVIEWMASA